MDDDSTEDEDGFFEVFMKQFVYIFILDLGISPFIKCYQEKSLIQACIVSRRYDFLRELLSHQYELITPKAFEEFEKSCKGKDYKGNNIFHDIFMLDCKDRNRFLKVVYDPKYQVEAFLR